jgi:predicted acyl esterase
MKTLLSYACLISLTVAASIYPVESQAFQPASPVATPQPMKPFWSKRLVGYVTARDGTRLRYSVLLPAGNGPFPVIINYSGYDPGAIGGLAYRLGDTAMSTGLDQTLVEHGYAVMGVNARGTACSEGTFDFLGEKYGQDGYDIVEFAGTADWSTGAVGMANWSWAGMSQLMTAEERPSHLKAIAPGMVLGDARRDSWAPGGVPAPGFISAWRQYLHSRWATAELSAKQEGDATCLAQVKANLAGEEVHSIEKLVFSHPLRDDVIDQRAPGRRADLITVPVLSMESFQDEAVTSRSDYYQEKLDPQKVWIQQTNGGHDLYMSLQFRTKLIRFFDRFVKGQNNGFENQTPRLETWLETSSSGTDYDSKNQKAVPRFKFTSDKIDDSDVIPVEFKLTQGGKLGSVAVKAFGNDKFSYPIPGAVVSSDEAPESWGPLPAQWRKGSLAYTSPPLEHDFLASGSASADLWLSSTASDADVQVTLTEVRPDGQEMFVQRGWLRLSNRAQAPNATPLRPITIDTPDAIQPLLPDVPVLGRVELNKFAHAFRIGSRLRVWIDTPSQAGGYIFSPFSVPSAVTIWHDPDHVSILRLGQRKGVYIPPKRAVCGHVLQQPCRADPFGKSK